MDGKHFPMKDYQTGVTAPPFHPWCRSVTCPWFDDEFTAGETRVARDIKSGRTVQISSGTTYSKWEKLQESMYGKDYIDTTKEKLYNISADKKQFERYRNFFGRDFPSTFSEFQILKYNRKSDWERVKAKLRERGCLQEKLDYVMNGEKTFIPKGAKFEKAVVIAGNGTDKEIRDIKRLVGTYGGCPNEWEKCVGKIKSEKYVFDLHWYMNSDGIQQEMKIKERKVRKK